MEYESNPAPNPKPAPPRKAGPMTPIPNNFFCNLLLIIREASSVKPVPNPVSICVLNMLKLNKETYFVSNPIKNKPLQEMVPPTSPLKNVPFDAVPSNPH